MKTTKMMYALCGLLTLAVLGLTVSESTEVFASDCSGCAAKFCGWTTAPTVTTSTSAITGAFDTSTDADTHEMTINWCFADGNPIAGSFTFDSGNSTNIQACTYTPSSFSIYDCLGAQVTYATGNLTTKTSNGTLKTKAQIGAAPGCNKTHTLTVNHA